MLLLVSFLRYFGDKSILKNRSDLIKKMSSQITKVPSGSAESLQ